MSCCEANRMLCCNLRTGVLTWAITRLVLMLLGIPTCITLFTWYHDPGYLMILSVTLGACIFWAFFYSLLIHGVRKDILCIFILILVLQELEAITILVIAILFLIHFGFVNDWETFYWILFICGGSFIAMQYFVHILKSYYLQRKREREATYVQFTRDKENGDEAEDSVVVLVQGDVSRADDNDT